MSIALLATLGNDTWMAANREKIRQLFPETWTQVGNPEFSMLRIGWQFKMLGIDWRSEEELSKCFVFLTKVGVIEIQNPNIPDAVLIRRKP